MITPEEGSKIFTIYDVPEVIKIGKRKHSKIIIYVYMTKGSKLFA